MYIMLYLQSQYIEHKDRFKIDLKSITKLLNVYIEECNKNLQQFNAWYVQAEPKNKIIKRYVEYINCWLQHKFDDHALELFH